MIDWILKILLTLLFENIYWLLDDCENVGKILKSIKVNGDVGTKPIQFFLLRSNIAQCLTVAVFDFMHAITNEFNFNHSQYNIE